MRNTSKLIVTLGSLLALACSDDTGTDGGSASAGTETSATSSTTDNNETGESMGDGDGDPATGDGDGDPTTGDGDGDPTTGDGDGDPTTGDGDGDPTTGDGDGDGDVCGDGMVTGSEVCDDGINDGSYGGCNADCLSLAAYCGDMIQNGPEACDDANLDLDDGCLDDCTIPESCLAIFEYDDAAPDGEYLIAPAAWMDDPFPAFCDMTNDGGGWTLAMRFAPQGGQFEFWSTHWTQESLVNEATLDPADPSDGKFWAYDWVPGDDIRGCLQNPQNQQYGCKIYAMPMPSTLLELFTSVEVGSDASNKGLYFMETQPEKLEWLGIQGRTLAESSVNPNYVEVGINIDDDQSCYDARVRFGLVLNNEASVVTLNDAAGFGAQSYYTAACDIPDGMDSGWKTPAGFAAGPTIYSTAGHIWIR